MRQLHKCHISYNFDSNKLNYNIGSVQNTLRYKNYSSLYMLYIT